MGGLKKRKSDKRLERRVKSYEAMMSGGGKGTSTGTHLTKPGSKKK